MGGKRLLKGAGSTERATIGSPVTCHLLRLTPVVGTGGEEKVSGAALLLPPSLGGQWKASSSALLLTVANPLSHLLFRHRGHRPYLSLQRHSPHGQVAHGLIGDLPSPHREVIEGVGQLFRVILRRDLKQTGARQWRAVPVGTWAERRCCSPPGRPALHPPVPALAFGTLPPILHLSAQLLDLTAQARHNKGPGPGASLPCPSSASRQARAAVPAWKAAAHTGSWLCALVT